MRTLSILSMLGLGLLVACSEGDRATQAPEDPTIVATWQEGQTLSLADVDSALLALPPAERPSPADLTAAWAIDFVRDLVAQRWLLAKAERTGFSSDPELRAALNESRRNQAWQGLVREANSAVTPVTEAEIRREYEGRLDEQLQPERRAVYHLFLRRTPERGTEEIRRELDNLRQRVLGGENFPLLARESSESESRHDDGLMGTVAREDLVPGLAEVIFALPARVPSEPLVTTEGGHLFWVQMILRDTPPTFEQARPALVTLIAKRKASEAVEAAAAALAQPPSYFVATPAELSGLIESGDSESVVLRNGDYQITLGWLAHQLRQGSAGGLGADRLLKQFDSRERRYYQATESGFFATPEMRQVMAEVERRETVRILRRRELERLPSLQELEEFYADEGARFANPLAFRFARLTIPLGSPVESAATMARLETARQALNDGELDLAKLATELGGAVDELNWLPMAQILKERPRAAALVSGLAAGEHSPPYRYRDMLELLRVLERREPERPALSSIVEQVRQAYLEKREQQLYRRWIDSLANDLELAVFEERLGGLGTASLDAVATEQLEAGD